MHGLLHGLAHRRLAGGALVAAAICFPVAAGATTDAPESAAAQSPSEAQAALDAADAAAAEGDYDRALVEYKRAKELDPNLDVDEPLAMAHFRVGTASYSRGQYEKALESFQDAQGLYPSPNFHYNIAQCYEQLERPRQAIDSYRAFLRAVPDTGDRANIESKIARLEKQLARQEDTQDQPAREPRTTQSSTPDQDVAKHPGRGMIVTGAVLTGIGAAVGLGGGLAFGLSARRQGREVNRVFEGGNPAELTLAETEALDASGRRAQRNQIIFASAGGAVAAVGVALIAVGLVEKKGAEKVRASAAFGPGLAGINVTGRF